MRTCRGNPIDKKYPYQMLSNRVCIGETAHKWDSFPGEYDAIVDRAFWDKVHLIQEESTRRTRSQSPSLFKNLVFVPDGAAFSPTHWKTWKVSPAIN